MTAASELSAVVGCAAACRALDLPRASFYRSRKPRLERDTVDTGRPSPRALSEIERQTVLGYLHEMCIRDST